MHLEIFSELPSTTLLFPPRGTIVRQVGVGIIVEKSWHDGLRQSAMDAEVWRFEARVDLRGVRPVERWRRKERKKVRGVESRTLPEVTS